jgi:hypothetical protein
MGVEVYFAVEGEAEPVEGDLAASNSGWGAWSEWASGLDADAFPTVVGLAEDGFADLGALEDELKRLAKKPPGSPDADIRGVTARLVEILGEKPDGAIGVVCSDGEAAEAGEPGEDEDQ